MLYVTSVQRKRERRKPMPSFRFYYVHAGLRITYFVFAPNVIAAIEKMIRDLDSLEVAESPEHIVEATSVAEWGESYVARSLALYHEARANGCTAAEAVAEALGLDYESAH